MNVINRINHVSIIFILAWLVPQSVSALTVSGNVRELGGNAIEFANIALYNMVDTAFVCGTVTDGEGNYSLVTSDDSPCFFKCSFIGYEPFISIASTANSVIDVVMYRDTYALNEVTVSASAPENRLTARGLITNVSNTLLAALGTADDILDYIPLVVREGESFSVFGHGQPIFYINGRKMPDRYELQRIQSRDVVSVEVITNPGAKYPASVSSVIMIKTRRPTGEGISGALGSDYQQAHKSAFTEQGSLNYRSGGWDVFTQFGFNKSTSREVNDSYLGIETDRIWEHIASEHIQNITKHMSVTGGINYTVSDKSSAGVRYTFSSTPLSRESGVRLSESLENTDLADVINARIDILQKKNPSHLLNAYYVGAIGDVDVNLNIDYVESKKGSILNNEEHNQAGDVRRVNSESDIMNRLIASKLIMEFPLLGGKVSAGAEISHTNRHDNYSNRENYVKATNTRLVNTNVAPFVEYAKNLRFGEFSVGLRFEHLNFKYYEDGVKMDGQSRKYSHLYPSFAWSKRFGGVQLQASYNLYTTHPTYSELSGNVIYANRYQYQTGNPYLKSGINHNGSLTGMWRFVILNIGYDDKRDAIIHSMKVSPLNPSVSVLSYTNVPTIKTAFAYLTLRPVFGVYRPQLMLAFSKQWFSLRSVGDMVHLGKPLYSARLNNIFVLPNDWQLNVSGFVASRHSMLNYNDQRISGQCNLSVYKWFMKKSLQIRVTANDIFETSKTEIYYFMDCARGTQHSYSDSRNFSVGVRYYFNPTKSKYRGRGAGQAEKDRM